MVHETPCHVNDSRPVIPLIDNSALMVVHVLYHLVVVTDLA